MIAPQSPPPQVLISAEAVLAVDVPSQRLPSVAAVQRGARPFAKAVSPARVARMASNGGHIER
jgi:hypothetical protein